MPDPPTSLSDLAGRQLGDYRVLRKIGAGGMAEVYLAEQQSLGRQVALKVLPATLATDATYVERFLNEARAAAALVHGNIVQIYEVGQADGVRFIAQEYVRGKNLAELLRREGALQPRLVLDVMRQVVAALGRAAELGIVHRDVKPENIMLSDSGEVKVADFGLARISSSDTKTLTQVGVAMGTPLYMSPEQIEGRPVDVRSDFYGLGVTCYHLLAGTPPFEGDSALAIAMQHLKTAPRPLENLRDDVPSGLARVIHRMMAKKPSGRYDSATEVMGELRALAQEAAAAGWGDGPEQWSLAEWMQSGASGSMTAEHLADLMKASAKLDEDQNRRRRLWRTVGIAAVAGVLFAVVTRPRSYLEATPVTKVEPRDSAWAQIFQAKMAPSEAAWQAVFDNFPDEDRYVLGVARQGLIRFYLLQSDDAAKAQRELAELRTSAPAEGFLPEQEAFLNAAECIAQEQLGNKEGARDARSRITSEMRDLLEDSDPQIFAMLRSSENALGD
ncbi:MAG: serine/threonine protein kinase [Planctomycetales bacterium]|nr:serine/threonine protein kinase [Planctomycetales bacterium]